MKTKARRSGIRIMAGLFMMLGSFAYIILLAVINGVLGYFCALGVTLFGALAIAKALGENIMLSYGWLMGLAIGCGGLRGLLRYLEQYSNHYIAFRLLAIIRDKVFKALRILCPAKLEDKKKGSIIALITSDIEALEVFYAHTISPICIALLVSTGVILFVGLLCSWYLALIALLGYLCIGILLPIAASKKQEQAGVEYRKEFSSFNAFFLDSIKGIRDIVLENAQEERKAEVNSRSDRLLLQTKKIKHEASKTSALTQLLVSFFSLLVLGIGILLVYVDKLSPGYLIVALVAVYGSFGPVISLASLPSNLTQTLAAGDRVLNLMEEKPAVEEIKDGKRFSFSELEVKNLSFGYEKNHPILKDISMYIQKGEIVGIQGESGCGKSTFLKLLLRFWEKDHGEIDYDKNDIDSINTDNLLDNVTMVSQSTYLFDDTILNNLLIAKEDATMSEVEEACKKASIHDTIMKLPEGYQSKVSAMGDNLSAGEKQRLGLARAFLKGSKLILLDEPTSNVDAINEGIILRSLAEQKEKVGIILVSHRESTMAIADRVYHFEDGVLSPVQA